ncbi:DUF2254 domain-containing protein [Pseudooceanicola sp. CBS1P-1]|uniref:DUF2254 domain-containing protein n=1 Tax=Pseudooceanicola albus TaxID=2692189 RepID=A0A6L7G0A1_9RHOB|nr:MULTISPECIES: DUF2254 domain-containing protein [Pseudooceanicola]MBT9383650.1 DUF2254 domain-containing protein [Pseudooceanicola endophyticus]MXN17505.1 DUF2254 domain-containing protein [Pseudooceanicola albus]
MLPSLFRKLHDVSRRLVVRVLLIAGLAILAVILARLGGRLIPPGLTGLVGPEAVDKILSIIANSMLTVTTFSLTIMAAVHRYVSGQWTPRAHQALLQDTVTQTVLATFVGAYLYALLAIILRETGGFDGPSLLVLYCTTLVVVAMIVIAIIRWISHMEQLGSLIETSSRIEERTTKAFQLRAAWPSLGARPLIFREIPKATHQVAACRSGYVCQIYQDRLQQAAQDVGAHVWLLHPVGAFVHRGQALARTESEDPELLRALAAAIQIGPLRNYDQDPEFGFICLREIAVRALSPGINDPGTAENILRRIARVLMGIDSPADGEGQRVLHDRLYIPALDTRRLTEDILVPILKDGAARPELAAPFEETLLALSAHVDPGISQSARDLRVRLHRSLAEDARHGL